MRKEVVIPCYHLVWYNAAIIAVTSAGVVIPCYHLVWYNRKGVHCHGWQL